MNTDADGDGELTPVEYALAVPDPNGKTDAGGLTPLQRNAFKADDLDGNGRLTRAEIQTRLARAYASSYWALTMAVRAWCADGNRSKDCKGKSQATTIRSVLATTRGVRGPLLWLRFAARLAVEFPKE